MVKGSQSQSRSKDLSFIPSHGLTTQQAETLLVKFGRNELQDKQKPKWLIFMEQLWQPMPIMIWIAAGTEAAIQNYPDMVILLFIQAINASLGYYEITKAGDAVAALKKSLKPLATVNRDGKWNNVDAGILVPGDLVLLAAGSAIPADCKVNHGTIEVDQAALTGESLPVTMYTGSECLMGSNVVRGEVEGTVINTGGNTFFGKTATLLQGDNELGNLQKILIKIMIVLVVISFTLSFIVFAYLLMQGNGIKDTISFTVVLIVASIPIAIEIVCTTTLALGSKELAKQGAIVTRLAAIEDLAGMNMLCSDKTGTLTMNKMVIQEETPVYCSPALNQYQLLRYAAMAAKWNEPPRDALDTLVLTTADLPSLKNVEQTDYMPFDPILKRTEATLIETISGKNKTYKVSKGAPNIIMKLCKNLDKKLICERDVDSFGDRGVRCLCVAKTKDGSMDDWELLGLLTFLDPPRHDTKETIHRAIAYGVEVKMITGDHLKIAMETARLLDLGPKVYVPGKGDIVLPRIRNSDGLPMLDPTTKKAPDVMKEEFGDFIRNGDGFAQVFPEHKFLIVQCLRELKFKVGMTGDGVNDAPALKRADVGIAVAGSTDAARAAADIILTNDGLSTIIDGIIIARCISQRMKNFITYRIAATLQLLVFFFVAVLTLHPVDFMPADWATNPDFTDTEAWPKFFAMPVLMLILITLLNDGTLISIGYDNVSPTKYPNTWNLTVIFVISSVLAFVALLSSLLLLYMMLESYKEDSFFHMLGFDGLSYGQIITAIYLNVSVLDFLTLFSARTHNDYFWSSTPSAILLGAALFALTVSTVLACVWPASTPDGIPTVGLFEGNTKSLVFVVWIYCLVWWLLQDFCKVFCYYILEKYNLFGIHDSVTNSASNGVRDSDRLPNDDFDPLEDDEFPIGKLSRKGSMQKSLRRSLLRV